MLLNSHGGNEAIGRVIVEKIGQRHPDAQIAMLTWWTLAHEALLDIRESGFGGVGHACEFETSLMLHLHPELVHVDATADPEMPETLLLGARRHADGTFSRALPIDESAIGRDGHGWPAELRVGRKGCKNFSRGHGPTVRDVERSAHRGAVMNALWMLTGALALVQGLAPVTSAEFRRRRGGDELDDQRPITA